MSRRRPNPASLLALALMLAWPAAALPQDSPHDQALLREMQHSSTERDRQSDTFALQLRQQQRELLAPPQDLPALQERHAAERRDFDRLLEEQRRSERSDVVRWGPRLDVRPRMEQERRGAVDRAGR